MKFFPGSIPGVFLIEPFCHSDERGSFVKTFHENEFMEHGLEVAFKESFYSISKKGVIRGMHFQLPPHEHSKLVFCTVGEVLDVVLDLRKDSPSYGHFESFQLNENNRSMVYIPKGCAHGFLAMSDLATVYYNTSTVHHPASDTGIRYDSFGFSWPEGDKVLSDRDLSFKSFNDFISPF